MSKCEYDYYLAEFKKVQSDAVKSIKSLLFRERLPLSLVCVIQQREEVKSSAKGSVLGVVNDYLLDTYCFFKSRQGVDIEFAFNRIRKKLSYCVELVVRDGRFYKLRDQEKKDLLRIEKKSAKFIEIKEQSFKKGALVQILKGRFQGYVGVANTDKCLYKQRNVEKVVLSDNVTVTVPRIFLRNVF